MRPSGHDAHDVLCGHNRRKPARPRPAHGAEDQPPAGLDVRETLLEERRGPLDVLNDLEQRQDVHAVGRRRGSRQVFNGRVEICQAAGLQQERVGALVFARDGDDLGGGIYGCHGGRVREASGGFGEDAAAAANV